MKINISYTSTKYFDRTTIKGWVWTFKRYSYIKGFIMRICGVYFNVREKYASEKLMKIARNKIA